MTVHDFKNWWKDWKLVLGMFLIVFNLALGFYGKALIIAKYYEPIYVLTGISLWVLSWLLMFVGVFLVGRETVIMVKNWIRKEIRNAAIKSYDATKGQAQKGINYTKKLHKKGMDKFRKTRKSFENG